MPRVRESARQIAKKRYLMPAIWTFRCYISARGTDEVRAWYNNLSPAAQAKFDSRIKILAQNERQLWQRPLFALLKGQGAGLGEIRFDADKVQHRPIGYFGRENTFTIVFCAIERGDRFEPKNALEVAQKRREETMNNEDRVHDCDFDLE